jgi:hypothetical protein
MKSCIFYGNSKVFLKKLLKQQNKKTCGVMLLTVEILFNYPGYLTSC